MDIFDGLFQYLSSCAALVTLIGNPLKMYPDIAPQIAARPYIVFTCHSMNREIHLKGASAITDFLVQFDVWANDSSMRFQVADALRNFLHCRTNVLLCDTSGNKAAMEFAEIQSDMLSMRPPPDGSEEAIFCREMVFRLVIDEPVPTLP